MAAFLVMGIEAAQPVKKANRRNVSTSKTTTSKTTTPKSSNCKGKTAKKGPSVVFSSEELKQNYLNDGDRPLVMYFFDCTVTGLKGSNVDLSIVLFKDDPETCLSNCVKNKVSYENYVKAEEAKDDELVDELGLYALFAVGSNIVYRYKLSNGNVATYSISEYVGSDPCKLMGLSCGIYSDLLSTITRIDDCYAVVVATLPQSDIVIGYSKIIKFRKQ